MVLEVGRICVKTAGREANKLCCVVELIDKNYVMIDGGVRRKKCNINHLEPLPQKIDLSKNDDTSTVLKAMSALNLKVMGKKDKKVETAEKPTKKRKTKKVESEKPKKKQKEVKPKKSK